MVLPMLRLQHRLGFTLDFHARFKRSAHVFALFRLIFNPILGTFHFGFSPPMLQSSCLYLGLLAYDARED